MGADTVNITKIIALRTGGPLGVPEDQQENEVSEEKERWAKETPRRGTEGGDGSKSADEREDERAEERDWS